MMSRLRPFALFLVLSLGALQPAALPAQETVERIAAVVNEDVISLSDVIARLRLALLSSGLQATDENRQRLLPQVLRSLIDETLQRQEAESLGIAVDPADIEEGIASVAAQNNLQAEQLRRLLAENDIPVATLEDQIEASMAWSQLIQRRLVPVANVGDEDVDETLARLEANRGRPEYLLSEIFLSVDDPEREAEVQRLAASLVDQVRGGASFSAVARQFSQTAGAADGGDLGWIAASQLDPALAPAIAGLQPGQISDPVRSLAGYHILLVRDQRRALEAGTGEAVITLRRLALGYPPDASQSQRERIMAIARDASAGLQGCDQLQARADELGIGGTTDGGTGAVRELPPPLQTVVRDLPVGEPSPPQELAEGVMVFMVCDRQIPESGAPSREQIAEALVRERVDLLQRRYLRDLRSAAFIDVRV